MAEIVYVLTNPAMPGLVKIGMTTQVDVEARMRQLFTTGVPFQFECFYACQVRDARDVEGRLHLAFGDRRVNETREFFRVEPHRVKAVLEMARVDDVTEQLEAALESDTTAVDRQAAETFKRRMRPKLNFHELEIPDGSILIFQDGMRQAEVIAPSKVRFDGQECSLTMATRRAKGLSEDYPLQPSPYWTFNGRTLKEIYEEFHAVDDAE